MNRLGFKSKAAVSKNWAERDKSSDKIEAHKEIDQSLQVPQIKTSLRQWGVNILEEMSYRVSSSPREYENFDAVVSQLIMNAVMKEFWEKEQSSVWLQNKDNGQRTYRINFKAPL
jgi:hypothetical protein